MPGLVRFEGDPPPGSEVTVRVWDGGQSAAWPADGSSWYMWLGPLLGGAAGTAVTISALVRWVRFART